MPDLLHALPTLLFGFVAGLVIYLSGVGGGVIVVPTLVSVFGLPAGAAIGTASVFSFLCKIGAGWSHARQGHVSKDMMRAFLWVALAFCMACAAFINGLNWFMPAWSARINLVLKLLTLIVGGFALASILVVSVKQQLTRLGLKGSASITGALVGATGTGGGVLVVPALLANASASAQVAVGTSIWIGLVLSAVTGVFYGASGNIVWPTVALMFAGSLMSMPAGAYVFKRLTQGQIKGITVALGAVALAMLLINIIQSL